MNKLKLNTKDESLREILGNSKKYNIPKFQRDYSWEKEQLEILWEDMQEVIQSEEYYHYMGYLVLQETDINQYKIIDGQQRLTTFSLLVLSCIKRLKEINEQERSDEIFRSFIGVKDLKTLYVYKKLTLNINNQYYYNEAVEGRELPQRGKKKTVHLMRQTIDFFYDKVKEYKGKEIGGLIEKISNQLLFTTIYIADEMNAYKVFETLNARGVQLSSADLLKNYIFSLIEGKDTIPKEALDELEKKWKNIGDSIKDRYYTDYILCEWNSRHKIVRKRKLYASIKKEINDKNKAHNYLNLIAQKSSLYEALINADSDLFKNEGEYKSIKASISFLKLFNIKQPHSLLMIAYEKHQNDFHKILKWIQILSLRYNVICRDHPGEQEQLYNKICIRINEGCKLQEIKNKILELYPSDETFQIAFAGKTMLTQQSNKKAKYILARLEEYQNSQTIDEGRLTIEHILPQNPNEKWVDSFGNNYDLFTQRMGNMALVKTDENKQLGQKSFDEKKELLEKHNYSINKNIAEYEEWTSQEVESRQKYLAKTAADLWKID